MNTDTRTAGTDNTTERGRSAPPAQPMGIRLAFREIWKGIVVVWWGFFDWLAAVSWKALLLVSFLGLILAGMFKVPVLALGLIIASFIIKVVAGGKRRAE